MPSSGIVTRPAYSEDHMVPLITYGAAFHILISDHLKTAHPEISRIGVLASTGLVKNHPEHLTNLRTELDGKIVDVQTGVASHTHWDDLIKLSKHFAGLSIDCIVTVGAGSLTDAAKILAWMLANDVRDTSGLEKMWSGSPCEDITSLNPPTIVTIAVPTSLSGGEYQRLAGGTKSDGSEKKCPFYPPEKNPALVVLDPALCRTTPERVWLSTGIRAVDHCVETLCSLQSDDAGDDAATTGLIKLIKGLIKTKGDPNDLEARQESQFGVIDAMNAVSSGVPLGGSHAIGHQLGPMGVPHGETSCICLPAVCRWNLQQAIKHKNTYAQQRQEKCRDVLLQDPELRSWIQTQTNPSQSELEAQQHDHQQDLILDLGDILFLVIKSLALPQTLTEVNIPRVKLDKLAENTLADPWAATNVIPLTRKEQVIEILEMVV